ncbi:MAG: cytochrome c biogenesis protein CcsA [Fimbriimonadaceae bacterium]
MWDPVENTSFVPWVVVAALIHGIIMQVTRGSWKMGNVVLAALPFLLFGYGTFLTRSGFLGDTSVHSFAEMDRSALWILVGIVLASTLGFVGLLLTHGKEIARSGTLAPKAKTEGFWHKERMYGYGIWLLLATGVVTGIGMSVPLLQSLAGKSPKVVEEHLYHQVLAWPYPIIVFLIGLTPFLSWKEKPVKEILGSLINIFAVTFFVVGCLTLWVKWAGKRA